MTVAANSATGIGVPNGYRRARAHRLMSALFYRPQPAHACAQRGSLYGGRRGGAFGLTGFLYPRYANLAPSVTLIGVSGTGSTRYRNPPMPAPYRAACACLRVTPAPHGPRLEAVFADLHAATGASLAAAAGLSAALAHGMIDHGDMYELLRTVHARLSQAAAAAERVALRQERAA